MSKYVRNLIGVSLAAMTVGLLACDDSGPTSNGNGNGNGTRAATLSGDITGNRTLSADTTYTVVGFVQILPGATLTIPAGTVLLSDNASRGSLITNRCSATQPSGRLVIQGTPTNPVRFRPVATSGRQRGQAAGVVLHGCAPINVPGGTGIGEGTGQAFGGDNPADDSGSIQYLTIEFGGRQIAPDNEINGLTMSGVGTGTVIENVQAHFIADDGFEWFGGTVNGSFLVSSGNDDDAFDCDFGWSGTVQFLFAIQDRNRANRGVECDNDADGSENLPITNPTVWNATWVGAGVARANSDVNDGLYFRRNTAGAFRNLVITNFGNAGVVFDGSAVWSHVTSGTLVLNNALFFNNQCLESPAACGGADAVSNIVRRTTADGYFSTDVATQFAGATLVEADPQFMSVNFANPTDGSQPDPRPAAGSAALNAANAETPTGPGVDGSADFLGAFSTTNWLQGWTIWATQ